MLESIQALSYGVATTFFILATITILLRVYSRGFVVRSFGWDDWCMVSILFFNAGHQSILYYFLEHGGGLRIMKVITEHPEWMQDLIYALFAEEIMYSLMHFIIKTAFLLFYLRFATQVFRKLVYCTIGINTLLTLITILLYCFQCRPLDAFFNPAKHPGVKCLTNTVLAFVPAAFSIFVDVLIVVLPIQPLWTIQVSLRKRLALISIISLGGVVVLISCIRLVVLLEFQKTGADFTFVLGKLIIISSIELEVAIMAANAPSLKILFQKWFGNKDSFNSTSDATLGKGNAAGGGRSGNPNGSSRGHQKRKSGYNNGLGYVVDCSNYVPMSPTPRKEQQAEKRQSQGYLTSGSEEQLWKHDSGIIVTVAVGVETSEPEARRSSPVSSSSVADGKTVYGDQAC